MRVIFIHSVIVCYNFLYLLQCSKSLPVRQPETDNFGGGLGTFLKLSSILCLWFGIQDSRTDNFFIEFWTLLTDINQCDSPTMYTIT